MSQFQSFVHKEFLHIFRDRRTMLILIVLPVVLIILFGFAITTEVKDSRVALVIPSKDHVTRQIRERIAANTYFTITHDLTDPAAAELLFHKNEIDLALVFSENFAEEMQRSGKATVQILADGTEPNQASVRTGYAQQVLMDCKRDLTSRQTLRPQYLIVPETRLLYNPQSKSEYNFVPGVIGLILLLICVMMTSISIVREKEMGTMEVLLASPLPPIFIVLAKLVPYFAISCFNLATLLLLSAVLLHIPMAGSLIGFIGISMLYILTALALGLLISTAVNTQLAAMLLSLLLIVPTIYLSGLTFPLESMPPALQKASVVVPARWYINAARKLMIQGVEMKYVAKDALILGGMALSFIGISWKLFKTKLE